LSGNLWREIRGVGVSVCVLQTGRTRFALLFLALTIFLACDQNMAQNSSPSPKRDINAVLATHEKELLVISGVVGVYVATLEDRHTLCLKVMLAHKTPQSRKIPRSIEGYPVVIEVTGEIRPMDKP
jgi:hypothetical protein